ncbi:MAG TPA: SDR family oxidoreductase [Steroidobacteraceae bacterium]|nr:SDR family oxidoreductase [Steroidobacteraceae bacterium]
MGQIMKGKTVVITGATSGIGEVAARELAGMGARVVLVARDPARAEATLAQLRAINANASHSAHYGDLSRLADMKRMGLEIAAAEPRIDVLINNAGALFGSREVTEDTWERTFATNHMAYFVLTHMLRERLTLSRARIVNTSSSAHKGCSIDFDDLQSAKRYSPLEVYGRSKLCNIMFTRELARRWGKEGVTANCFHPGFVASRFGAGSGGLIARLIAVGRTFAISPEKGAQTLVYLASSPEVSKVSGAYFYKCRAATPSARARDDVAAGRLWAESAKLAGIDG